MKISMCHDAQRHPAVEWVFCPICGAKRPEPEKKVTAHKLIGAIREFFGWDLLQSKSWYDRMLAESEMLTVKEPEPPCTCDTDECPRHDPNMKPEPEKHFNFKSVSHSRRKPGVLTRATESEPECEHAWKFDKADEMHCTRCSVKAWIQSKEPEQKKLWEKMQDKNFLDGEKSFKEGFRFATNRDFRVQMLYKGCANTAIEAVMEVIDSLDPGHHSRDTNEVVKDYIDELRRRLRELL